MDSAISEQETKVVRSYTDAERRLAVACYQRYGLRAAERVLSDAWEHGPAQPTLIAWSRDITPTEDDAEFWRLVEEGRKRTLQAEFMSLTLPAADAFREFAEKREAGKMQQTAIALGILYDKLVPGPKMSGGGVSIQNAENVQLMVVSPTETGAPRRAVDASFTHVESPGAEDE